MKTASAVDFSDVKLNWSFLILTIASHLILSKKVV